MLRWGLAMLLAVPGVAAPAAVKKHGVAGKAAAHGAAKAGKARPSKAKSASRSGVRGGAAGRLVKGNKARIPRTLRTVPANPVVRMTTAERLEAQLTRSGNILYPEALRPFFAALAAEEADHTSTTLRVLQFGDSHTAADLFTGELRTRLQARFGDGGLGFQFPGHPFPGYHLVGSTRSESSGWVTEGNRFTALGDGDLGLGGISIATDRAGETTSLEAACTTLQVHYLQQPSGGRLQFTDNGTAMATIETAPAGDASGSTSGAGTFTYSCQPGSHVYTVTTMDAAPVKLLGMVTEQPGITYECLGINGAVAPLMLRWNQALFASYLRQRDPALIVLAYGTNEAAMSAEHLQTYATEFNQLLTNLHQIVPGAAVLVLGPADRSMGVTRTSGRPGRRNFRRTTAWHPFPGTERVIAIQREACRTHGCAFWDAQRRMGGLGAMQQWVAAGWGQPDRTHLTGTGYRELAAALFADLLRAYTLSQEGGPASTQTSAATRPATGFEESSSGQARPHP